MIPNYHFPDAAILHPGFDLAFKAVFSRNNELTRDLIRCALDLGSELAGISFINNELSPELSPELDGSKTPEFPALPKALR